MPTKTLIELKKVKFRYPGNSKLTLNIEDLTITKSEKIFIFGPSGTGKTTLLEVLSGVLVPEEGLVIISGTELRFLTDTQRDRFRSETMGFVFQGLNLLPYLNVQENIELPLKLRGIDPQRDSEFQKLFNRLVECLGILEILQKSVTQISVGQQQRVAVARALLGKPQILFADEPTSSLDYDNREKFLKLLFELSNEIGTTVLFVSHDRSLQPLFDRTIDFMNLNYINQGQET